MTESRSHQTTANRNVKEVRYTCGQQHTKQNPNWKPFQVLERYCRKHGYNNYEALDVIEAQIGRRLKCECELLGG